MVPNPRKTKTIRRLGEVDISELKAAILAVPEDIWNAENESKPNRFDALDSTRHIVFRFVSDFSDWQCSYDRPVWEVWRPLIAPLLLKATAGYGYARGEYPRVMLARMSPGGEIQPHRDANRAAKWPHKIHIPLQTNPNVTFFVEGLGYHFTEGEAVEVNNMAVHSVRNDGDTDRIHLIFEYYDLDQLDPS